MQSKRNLVLVAACAFIAMACAACDDDTSSQEDILVAQDTAPDQDSGWPDTEQDDVVDSTADTAAVDTPVDTCDACDTVPGDVAADGGQDTAPDVADDTAGGGDTRDTTATDTSPSDTADAADVPQTIGNTCFADIFDLSDPGPDYDQFSPTVGGHCLGTNHQDIAGIEQVVFMGDSVTVGTPNVAHPLTTDNAHFYRNLLATWLASRYSLDTGSFIDWGLWRSYDLINGVGAKRQSGDFWNCSKWGARTDDFLGTTDCTSDGECLPGETCVGGKCPRQADKQIPQCFPGGGSARNTLIVFTMGGNDISSIAQEGALGDNPTPDQVAAAEARAWDLADRTVAHLEEAMAYLKDPVRFPNGSHVVFANPFEFTDATGDMSSCPAAGLAGFDDWVNPDELERIVTSVLEGYMRVAVAYDVDMIWLLEGFCGHGFVASGSSGNRQTRCHRDPQVTCASDAACPYGFECAVSQGRCVAELYFDETCIHPSEAGHHAIFSMFQAVVME